MINITIERKHVYLLAVIVTLAALLVPASAWASNRFTDVPDTSIFHDDIEWLADAGVTKGCNPPANDEFCPKDVVTREQLAAFMHRLSAAGGSYKVEAITEVPASSTGYGATARCELGDVVSGGGFRWSFESDGSSTGGGSGIVVYRSSPVDATNSDGEGWSVTTRSDRGAAPNLYVVAVAVCDKSP